MNYRGFSIIFFESLGSVLEDLGFYLGVKWLIYYFCKKENGFVDFCYYCCKVGV